MGQLREPDIVPHTGRRGGLVLGSHMTQLSHMIELSLWIWSIHPLWQAKGCVNLTPDTCRFCARNSLLEMGKDQCAFALQGCHVALPADVYKRV